MDQGQLMQDPFSHYVIHLNCVGVVVVVVIALWSADLCSKLAGGRRANQEDSVGWSELDSIW